MRSRSLIAPLSLAPTMFAAMAASAVAGDLFPPTGPIAPTMKRLDEVEPRTCIQALPGDAEAKHVITESGSYYLTDNIQTQLGQTAIKVLASEVTIDGRGFSLIGPGSGIGVQAAEPVGGSYLKWEMKDCIITSYSTGVSVSGVDHVTLSSVTIANTTGDGVQVSESISLNFKKIKVSGCGGDGAQASETISLNFEKINVSNCGGDGVQVSGNGDSSCWIRVAQISACGGDGVSLSDLGAAVCEDLSVDGCTGNGFACSDSSITFERCSAQGNTLDGYRIRRTFDASTPLLYKACTSSNNGEEGYDVLDAACSFDDCHASDNVASGFRVQHTIDAATPDLYKACTSGGNGGSGFELTEGSITMEACSAQGNTLDGYKVTKTLDKSTPLLMQKCASGTNGDDGYDLTDGALTLESCGAYANIVDGFKMAATVDKATPKLMQSCASGDNGGNGYTVVNTAADRKDMLQWFMCAAAGNSGHGYALSDISTVCVSSSATDNGGDGYNLGTNLGNNENWDFQGCYAGDNAQDGWNASGEAYSLKILDCSSQLNLNDGLEATGTGAERVQVFVTNSHAGPFNAANGVKVTNAKLYCSDARCNGNGGNGVSAEGASHVLVWDSAADLNGANGVSVSDGRLTGRGIVATDNMQDGFSLSDSEADCVDVVLQANGGNGFSSTAAAGSVVQHNMTDFEFLRNAGNGATFTNGRYVLRSGIASGNTGGGISADAADGALDGVDASANSGGGLIVLNGGTLTVSDGSIFSNTGSGVTVSGDVILKGSKIHENSATGIDVTGTLTVSGGAVSSNGAGGLTVTGGLDIRGASVSGNTGDGINVVPHTAGTYVFELTVSDNTGQGITINDGGTGVACTGHLRIEGSVCNNNGSNGIDVQCSGGGEIARCTASGNTGTGIAVGRDASHVRVSENTLTGNVTGLSVISLGNLVVQNSAGDNSGTNYSVSAPGNAMGPIVDETNIGTDCNPHANYEF